MTRRIDGTQGMKAKTAEVPVDPPQSAQPLLEHLTELRDRLLLCVGALLLVFIACYVFAPEIYRILVHPLAAALAGQDRRLIYTGLTEAFVTYVTLAFWTATMICLPFFLIQLWRFIAPGLYKRERQAFLPFLVATPILFYAGAALVYFFIFSLAWHFFLGFESAAAGGSLPIQLEARVSEYLNLSMHFIMAFGIAFELPVLLLLLVQLGILNAQDLIEKRRIAIVVIFIIAAVLTPPDVLSQLCLAFPLLLLYEIAVFGAKRIERERLRHAPD